MAFPSTDPASMWPRRRNRLIPLLSMRSALFAAFCSATAVVAQVGITDAPETEPGLPVTDGMTIAKCAACHTSDAKGNLSRISWLRTTPEGWSQAIKRMVKLNGLTITADESRHIIRYLSDQHGLAPDEAKPVMYLPEHRIVDETNIPSESVRGGCAACHAFAQPLSWRRSAKEWKLLQDLHVALYQQADVQYRRPAADEPGPVFGQTTPIIQKPGALPITQGKISLDYIRKAAPLQTPEWTQWSSRMQAPRLAGRWLVSAFAPGRGRFVGTMTIGAGAEPTEFTTQTALRSLDGATALTRRGTGIVYTGYSWRGRSAATAAPAGPDSLDNPTRETLWFAPDRKTAQGRWFWGEYQEFGYDVKLTRAEGAPAIAAVAPYSIKAGSKDVQVHIYGDALPTSAATGDIDMGSGLTVNRIVSAAPGEIVVSVDADADAAAGARDVSVGSAVLGAALPVYRKISYLKVTPETAIARLGGDKHPPGYDQFDAWGYDNGADGKPYTADDINAGIVAADWSIQEFQSTWFDDDQQFVGKLSSSALFTPNIDGPNPARSNGRNNYGDVWVVATARNEMDGQGKPLTGKAYMVVTVPMYKRIDQPEVSQ